MKKARSERHFSFPGHAGLTLLRAGGSPEILSYKLLFLCSNDSRKFNYSGLINFVFCFCKTIYTLENEINQKEAQIRIDIIFLTSFFLSHYGIVELFSKKSKK